MTMLIGSCAKSLPAPVVVDTACSWVRIIYLTDHDIDVLDKQTKRDILAHNKAVLANCPQSTEKGYEMSEAKPQDGSTVKGYRTLTAGDIGRMNHLKGVSRHFCSLLDTERGELLAVRNGPAMLSAEQAREIDEAMRSLEIARTKMQEACMWACRAVARPDADC